MLRNEGDRLTKVVVSRPGDAYFDPSTHKANNINEVADRDEMQRQYDRLTSVMQAFGSDVIDVPELPGHPNSVFTRDVSLCTPKGHIKLRMGIAGRRGEEEWMSRVLTSLGEHCVGEITQPGTAEGGDVILAGSVAFVGLSRRTNPEGARQLASLLNDMDYDVRTVGVPKQHLHLGGAMSAIGPDRLLCCEGVLQREQLTGFDVLEVPLHGPSTGNVICLGANELIANVAENAHAIGILESEGVVVHSIDLSEFRKGAGGPTCMVLPVERR